MHHAKHGAGHLRADSLCFLIMLQMARKLRRRPASILSQLINKYMLERREGRRRRKSKKQLRMLGKCNLKADACKALVLSERTRQKLVLQSNQAGLHLR